MHDRALASDTEIRSRDAKSYASVVPICTTEAVYSHWIAKLPSGVSSPNEIDETVTSVNVIGLILIVGLQVFGIAMWGRFILDWVQVLSPSFRPKGLLLVIAELVYTVTDPPLRLVRRFVKPIPLGGASLDLAWVVVMLLIGFASSLITIYVL